MSETQSLVEQLQLEIHEIAAPLVARYEQVKRDIDQRAAELDDLRKARTQLGKVIRNIDPTLIEPPNYKSNGKKKKGGPGGGVSAERIERFANWLRENASAINAQGGVHASGIIDGNGIVRFPGYEVEGVNSQTIISKCFQALHDQGIVRLDHMGNGGAKFYKVVT